jgi:hypothetical protein
VQQSSTNRNSYCDVTDWWKNPRRNRKKLTTM